MSEQQSTILSVDLDDDRLLVHALTRETGQAVREGQLDAMVPRDVEEVAA